MRKVCFFMVVVMLSSLGVKAQSIIDFYSQNDEKSQTHVHQIDLQKVSPELPFMLASFGSLYDTTKTYFGEKDVITGADYRVKAPGASKNSYNSNLLFALINTNSSLKWTVRSIEGNFVHSGSKFCPTKDGGAVVCAKFNKIVTSAKKDTIYDSNKTDSIVEINTITYYHPVVLRIVDKFGDTIEYVSSSTELKTKQENVTVIFKVSSDGRISTVGNAFIVANTTDPFTVKGITEDVSGKMYVCGKPSSDFKYILGQDTTEFSATGETNMVIKIDTDLKYISDATITTPAQLNLNHILWSDTSLYLAGFTNQKELSFVQMKPSLDVIKNSATSLNHNSVNGNIMHNTFVTFDNDSNLYVTGGFKGVIRFGDDSICNDNLNYRGCIIIINKRDLSIKKAVVMPKAVYSLYYGLGKSSNAYYTFNYNTGDAIAIYKYDKDLSLLNSTEEGTLLMNNGITAAVTAVCTRDTNFIVAVRTKGEGVVTFPNDVTYKGKTSSFYSLLFSTQSDPTSGIYPPVSDETNNDDVKKIIENGAVIIIKNGVRYNAQGQAIK